MNPLQMDKSTIVSTYFSSELGFGKYKATAVELLRQTITMLNEFEIPYVLISGTLLGYVRHADFIPWDDDIDLLVNSKILGLIDKLQEKYSSVLTFLNRGFMLKTCFKEKEKVLSGTVWDTYLVNKSDKYTWPFIDLFIYDCPDPETIIFFERKWDASAFFPANEVTFLNMTVCIPNEPAYFLEENYGYGENYMNILVSNAYSHKNEFGISTIVKLDYDSYSRYR